MTKKFLLGLAVCLWVMTGTNAWADLVYGDYTYTESEGEVTITDYTGSGGDVIIPDTIDGTPVAAIGDGAFDYCNGLTSVTIGNNVTSIGNQAFELCSNLTDVTFPDSVITIGHNAFLFCASLTSVTIPYSVTNISTIAFQRCTSLNDILVAVNNPVYSSHEGVLYNKNKTMLIIYPGGRTGEFTLPDSVYEIGPRAFCGCSNLTSVTISDSVTSIGEYAFTYCDGLSSVILPDSLTSIGPGAFHWCTALASVIIPDSVINIGEEAFSGCNALSIAYFLGDAPTMETDVFIDTAPDFNICYTSEATGFDTPTWLGYPASDCACSYDTDCAESQECADGTCQLISQPDSWAWMSGADTADQAGVYGSKGVADTANMPGARYGSISWTDSSGDLWLFGGYDFDDNKRNDLWRYDTSTLEWTWMSGSNVSDQHGVYGTKGTPDADNAPGARYGSISWTDSSGDLWLFGGRGYWDEPDQYIILNDLWRYDISTNQWTWMGGMEEPAWYQGVYGTQGIPDAANVPPARWNSSAWTDSSGNLWLFGGLDTDENYLNDLWRYDISTNQWTWMSGSDTVNQTASYGIQGTPNASNIPGARSGSITWADSSGNLWLFGGDNTYHYFYLLNDLWRYDISTNQWTWMSGADTDGQAPVYGTQGIPDATNIPGARGIGLSWTDNFGRLWLFGGYGIHRTDGGMAEGHLNDLWLYDPAADTWAWISGADTFNQSGMHGTQGIPDADNNPGARSWSISWANNANNLWLFGGDGIDSAGDSGELSDLWRYELPECIIDSDCSDGTICMDNTCEATTDDPPAIGDGPFLAAGSWPVLPTDPENAFYLDQNYKVLWTFSDDYATCPEELCTHTAEYQTVGDSVWTALPVTTDASGTWYGETTLPIESLTNATTYAVRFTVKDCADQSTTSDEYYFRVARYDDPPVIGDGPFVAAGTWPVLASSEATAFVLDQDYNVLWTFSDDYAFCSGLCTHRARYKKIDDVEWTWLEVNTDASGEWYAYTTLPIESLDPGTYKFYFHVRDCDSQQTFADRIYYFTVE